jgi:hypothetical protein
MNQLGSILQNPIHNYLMDKNNSETLPHTHTINSGKL